MSKAFAFLSFGLNAGLMLGIALFLQDGISPTEYYRYSFGVATARTIGVFVFEWLRMAALRHYPGPDPELAPNLRGAFLGGQYVLGLCAIFVALILALITSDFYWLLIAVYAFATGAVDLQFIMLRFDSQLSLFSRLQTFRAIISLVLICSVAMTFRQGTAALLGAIAANFLTIAALGAVRPAFVFVMPTVSHILSLRKVAWYGISVAAAGGLYEAGPFILRCAASRGASDVSRAAFSLVMDLLQRPYNVILDATNGVFFPDAVREQHESPNTNNSALRFLYAIHAWCLLITFGCALAFRHELLSLVIKSELLPSVREVFPILTAFFLIHTANNYTCAIALILSAAGFRLTIQAALEFVCIAALSELWMSCFGLSIVSIASGGLVGAVLGFLLALGPWRTVPCQLPWYSWIAAMLTTLPLVLIGQIQTTEHIVGLCVKGLAAFSIITIAGIVGLVIPFGLTKKLHLQSGRIAWLTRFK